MNTKEIFTDIYNVNKWACEESKSGPGSRVSVNSLLLEKLKQFVNKNNIKSIVDCGCGDFNWMKLFDFNSIDYYLGIDIVEKLISENNSKFSDKKKSFKCMSLVENEIPKKDLIICKDVLFHLSYSEAIQTIKNIKKSGSKFLLSTSFTGFVNFDIKTGGWRPINLQDVPFNIGQPFEYWENIENRNDKYSNKSIGIWEISEIKLL